jgi:hypothetical protein
MSKKDLIETMMRTNPPAGNEDDAPFIDWRAVSEGLKHIRDADLNRLHRMVVELFSTADPDSPTRH